MATSTSINITYNGTSSFVKSAPIQQQFQLDTTNVNYLRYSTLTQDSVTLTVYTSSVVIPLTQLYAAAANTLAQISWPPVILGQPISASITHPASASFYVSASAELPITYNWYSQSYSQSLSSSFSKLTASVNYSGTNTPTLIYNNSAVLDSSSSFFCVLSNASGNTTSSYAQVFVF
jgi:hypothetical protein